MADELSIHEVAREAGVSIATVSRVLNQRARVAPETRRRVEQAMDRLNYHPNLRARALSLKRTDTLGLILPDLFGDYFGELMRGVDERTREAGMHLLVSRAANEEDEERLAAQLLGGGRVDGMVLMVSQRSEKLLNALARLDAPLVVIDQDVAHRHIDNLLVDNRTGARDATEHLVHIHGLQKLFFLGHQPGNIDAEERASGFADALAAAGIPALDEQLIPCTYDYECGFDALGRLAPALHAAAEKIGIVAANDDLARGAIDALQEHGIHVPSQAAVVGYDDSRIARLARPALTTVRVPLEEIGRQAVEMLLERSSGRRSESTKRIVKGQLVIRQSCGCNCDIPAQSNGAENHEK